MEGLIPYVYRAIVQYKCGHRLYGALVSPGDSGRFAWDSAYMRLPGDSGRFASEFLAEALPASQALYRRSLSQSPSPANIDDLAGAGSASMSNESKAPLPQPSVAAGSHRKSN